MYANHGDGEGEQDIARILVDRDDGSEVDAMYVNQNVGEGELYVHDWHRYVDDE